MNVEIIDNVLNAEEFVALRVSVGFSDIPIEQAKKALSKGLFNAVAICDEKVVGMGRIVGDGVMDNKRVVRGVSILSIIN